MDGCFWLYLAQDCRLSYCTVFLGGEEQVVRHRRGVCHVHVLQTFLMFSIVNWKTAPTRFLRTNWWVLAGEESGETFMSRTGERDMAHWNHPLDLHLAALSMEGWPRLELVVRGRDCFGKNQLAGYGTCLVPIKPGSHEVGMLAPVPIKPGSHEVGRRDRRVGGGTDFWR